MTFYRRMEVVVDFAEFAEANLAALTSFSVVLTGDRQKAHDVLADALIAASSRWHRIGRMDFPLAYVQRMVTSTFLSDRRKEQRRKTAPTSRPDILDRPFPDPNEVVLDRAEMRDLLHLLTPHQVAAVTLGTTWTCHMTTSPRPWGVVRPLHGRTSPTP